ncbi:HelD family protein [Solicola sp. PLA-1-18]|uniref:HelD family protein n=1 Tax=Solicola sp. PLA-1-18 TaxID=3380532 RepID=UPI003B7A430C
MPDSAELLHERDHLRRSRERLAAMRRRTESLEVQAGDAVSAAYLAGALWKRMVALEDDPEVPLFFGRLDYADDAAAGTRAERLYVGRRHVTDDVGDPMVIDWRAPVSRAFYRAGPDDPMGVELRRRFGFSHGEVTAYEDERLLHGDDAEESGGDILREEIERPRTGPMRDIVATIQPEQDAIVRADLATSVCVQGAPGTGKTAVGLHRAAYLLYAFGDQLSRQGVLVVGPNDSFLRYIGDVLPALGEIGPRQATVESLLDHTPVRAVDDADVAVVKAAPVMADVLRRAVWAHLVPQTETLVVPRGSRRWRVHAWDVEAEVAALRERGVRWEAGRRMLAQRLAHRVLVAMEDAGDSPDDRVQDAVARSRPVKAYVDAWWPRLRADAVVHRVLGDPEFLATVADDLLDEDRRALLQRRPVGRSPRSARWSVHDAALVDEVGDLLDRTPSQGHVVVDEAQDLSPMMLRAVARRSSTGSLTVLGDLAQATTPWASTTWSDALGHLGKPGAVVEELTRGFRVPADVIAYAARLLPSIAPSLSPPTSVRQTTGSLDVRRVDVASALVPAAVELADRPGTVGVVVADDRVHEVLAALRPVLPDVAVLGADDDVDRRVEVVPASLAKGLEFDHVLLLEPADLVEAEPDRTTGLRRLYVCLTRAVTSLVVLHGRDLPSELDR